MYAWLFRLHALEKAINNRGKEQKKLDWTTKNLCKWANLFNNPTYEICNTGYESQQVTCLKILKLKGCSNCRFARSSDRPEATVT